MSSRPAASSNAENAVASSADARRAVSARKVGSSNRSATASAARARVKMSYMADRS